MLLLSQPISPLDAHWGLIDRLIREIPSANSGGARRSQGVLDELDSWCETRHDEVTLGSLPVLTYRAAGGHGDRIIPIVSAWRSMHLAAKLFDDVEDGDVADHAGDVVNLASALLSVAQVALEELPACGVSATVASRLRQTFNRAVLSACVGQRADLLAARGGAPSLDPDAWLEVASAKSGELLGWAAWAGAVVADCDEHISSYYHRYGYHLGVLLQVADDFNGIWNPTGARDLARGCLTLPVCYALHVTAGEEGSLLRRWLQVAAQGDSVAVTLVSQALIDLGAQAHLLAVAQVQHQQATAAVRQANGVETVQEQLVALLEQVLPALKTARAGGD